MGSLRAVSDGRIIELSSHLLVGRSSRADLRLTAPQVSAEHARIAWGCNGWRIRDLGSRNGTFVNGARLEPGVEVAVGDGVRVAFGDSTVLFEWVSLEPPPARAWTAGGQLVRAREGILGLPDFDAPALVIFWQPDGWVMEDERGVRPAPAQVELAGHAWHIELPEILTSTLQESPRLCDTHLRLAVSLDEEYVATQIDLRGVVQTLPFRVHHYLLVILARRRQSNDGGWVQTERLARMLAMDRGALNVQIHRARREFAALGILDAANLIERHAGGVRLGAVNVELARLAS
jgi:hypothetical protein